MWNLKKLKNPKVLETDGTCDCQRGVSGEEGVTGLMAATAKNAECRVHADVRMHVYLPETVVADLRPPLGPVSVVSQ